MFVQFTDWFSYVQLQQIQQQLQAAAVATASQQHQQTEQVATASGGLTLALHHTAVSNIVIDKAGSENEVVSVLTHPHPNAFATMRTHCRSCGQNFL